jgi:hypothetical protein
MTPILGETEDGRKVTRRDSKILPIVVIYDVDLTLTLPVKMSVNSGINAIAHSSSCPHLPSAVQAVFPDVFLTIPDYFSRGTLR